MDILKSMYNLITHRLLAFQSCKDLSHYDPTLADGMYWLDVQGTEIPIYCHNIGSQEPKDYIYLQAGPDRNNAIFPDHRRTCDICNCSTEYYADGGVTKFQGVHIDLKVF